MTDATAVDPFNPLSADLVEDPFPVFERYRRIDPVHWTANSRGGGGRWSLFRHADVVEALSSPAIGREVPEAWRSPAPATHNAFFSTISAWMVFRDAPAHTHLRAAFHRALVSAGASRMRARIEALARDLADDLPGTGSFDLVRGFAFALPVRVVGDLMGIELEGLDRLRTWSTAMAAAIDLDPSPADMECADRAAREMTDYLKEMFVERRRAPGSDLVSALIAGDAGSDGPTEERLIANCIFFMCAGHETTTNLISSGVYRLLQCPEQFRLLRDRPQLLPRAVEEFLRFDSPVQSTSRIVLSDCEIGGRRVKRGHLLYALLGSANHDPAVFADPQRLDVLRSPNPHVAFGVGPHACLGAGLGRMEAEIAIRLCLERFPRMRLAGSRPNWRRRFAFRGLESLQVEA